MTYNDLIQKPFEELTRLARETSAQVRDLRFKITTRQASKVRDLRKAKRDLARIQTALSAKSALSSK